MNLIENYTDLSLLDMTGWEGSKSYDATEGCLVLTAKNGWRTFAWTIEPLPSEITFEFDYTFTNVENWGSCFVMNSESIGYDPLIKDIPKITDKWSHFKVDIPSPKRAIGINIRGVDDTGKSVVLLLRNPVIYSKQAANSSTIKRNGTCLSKCFNTCKGGDIISLGKSIITMGDLVEC